MSYPDAAWERVMTVQSDAQGVQWRAALVSGRGDSALLRQTARDLGSAGSDTEFGSGLLDVCRALEKVSAKGVSCR